MSNQASLVTELPDWLPAAAWKGYIDMRKSIKKPATERAIEILLRKLLVMSQAGNDIEAVLDQSVVNNWTDVYPVKNYEKIAVQNGMSPAATASQKNLQKYLDSQK